MQLPGSLPEDGAELPPHTHSRTETGRDPERTYINVSMRIRPFVSMSWRHASSPRAQHSGRVRKFTKRPLYSPTAVVAYGQA